MSFVSASEAVKLSLQKGELFRRIACLSAIRRSKNWAMSSDTREKFELAMCKGESTSSLFEA